MDANDKRYLKELGGSFAAYAVMLPISIWLLKGHEHSPLCFLFAVLPVIPAAFMMWAAIRYFRGVDELQRRIWFEGLAFSFVGTCLISLTWGFLENAGLPHVSVIWVAPLLIGLWGLGKAFSTKRYQ